MMSKARQCGFTLFELLVAVSILAIISAGAYSGLLQMENAQKQLTDTEARLAQIQLTFFNLERDLRQVVHRPIRNQYDLISPSLAGKGEYLLELTRGGVRNPAHVARSLLQRVAYVIEDDNLVRLSWSLLDQAQDSQPLKRTLLKKVSAIDIQFLDPAGNWSDFWPPPATGSSGTPALSADTFPRGVSVKLELPDIGNVQRIFVLPEA